MNRRELLQAAIASTALAPAASALAATGAGPKKRILLRSGWQTVNIGDIAHTPGMLHLLEQHLPDCPVTLWPSDAGDGVEEILRRRFPSLKIVHPTAETKAQVFADHDFLLHGSGPSLVAKQTVAEWKEQTGKPYGIGGITWAASTAERPLIDGARFAFFRDSKSLEAARTAGSTCPVLEFGPDATFACDLISDAPAAGWLREVGLEEGKFVCCIPKLRYTPYWEIKKGTAFNAKKHEHNESMKEHDIAPLREAVIAVARRTPMKVLLCPEDASQMKLNKEMIYDKLPDDVKPRVVWRKDYWLTDFAQGVYNCCVGLFGNEQHSPILCIGHGIPAIVCRFKEQTTKGYMWKDVGLGEWLFDHDHDEPAQRLTDAVLAIIHDPAAARAKAAKARAFADERMTRMMDVLRAELQTL